MPRVSSSMPASPDFVRKVWGPMKPKRLMSALRDQHGPPLVTGSGVNFMGSYWLRSFAARRSKRSICGSAAIAQRAVKYRSRKTSAPPRRLPSRLKVAAPRHMAKKKSFRSAPRMVSGRERDRCTGLLRRSRAMRISPVQAVSWKEPGEKVDGGNGHADAEEDAGKDALRTAFAERECQTGDDDRDEGESARNRAGERLLQDVNRVFPRRRALSERGSGEHESGKGDGHAARDENGSANPQIRSFHECPRHSEIRRGDSRVPRRYFWPQRGARTASGTDFPVFRRALPCRAARSA